MREDGYSGQAVRTVITLFSYSKVIVKADLLSQDKLSELLFSFLTAKAVYPGCLQQSHRYDDFAVRKQNITAKSSLR